AYHVTTIVRDGDWRALGRLLFHLPRTYYRRTKQRLTRRSDYPLRFILVEVLGTFAGPFALMRARRMVRKLGPSLVSDSTEHNGDAVYVESSVSQNPARQLVVALPAESPRA